MGRHGQNFKSLFQFGREAVWGTDVPATHRIPVLDLAPDVQLEVIKSDAMDGTRLRQGFYPGAKRVRVTVEFEMLYSGILLLLDGLFGTAAFGSNGGTTSGANPYVHVFKMRELFNSYTLELGMGDIPTTKVEQALGAKIIEATLSGSSHGVCRCRLVFLAKDYSTNVTPTGALSSPAIIPLLFDQLTAFNDGTGATGDILSFELSIQNTLSVRDYAAQLIDEPVANGFPEVQLKLVEEFQTQAAFDAHYALTQGAPSLDFVSGTKELVISMPKSYLTQGVNREKQGQGRMTQPLTWEPIGDDGSPETYMTITVTNAQATITS
jgi:hypothetical protein